MKNPAVALLRACAESTDSRRWDEFDERFRSRLAAGVTRALWRCGQESTRDRVDELIQETYCRLLAANRQVLRAFRGRTDGEAFVYLLRVAESVTIDRLRSRAAAKRGADLLVDEPLDGGRLALEVHDPGVSPESEILRRDLWRVFWRRCEALIGSRDKRRDLSILQLALFQGWTSEEIGRLKGLSASTVDTVIHRLRRRLARRGVSLPARGGAARIVAEGDSESFWNG